MLIAFDIKRKVGSKWWRQRRRGDVLLIEWAVMTFSFFVSSATIQGLFLSRLCFRHYLILPKKKKKYSSAHPLLPTVFWGEWDNVASISQGILLGLLRRCCKWHEPICGYGGPTLELKAPTTSEGGSVVDGGGYMSATHFAGDRFKTQAFLTRAVVGGPRAACNYYYPSNFNYHPHLIER